MAASRSSPSIGLLLSWRATSRQVRTQGRPIDRETKAAGIPESEARSSRRVAGCDPQKRTRRLSKKRPIIQKIP
jgi:hypothetical protein